ncbi:hypothetical protein AB0N77_20690 [Streptomyces misionensis]|uniref:hypothetical protein n=1 Tax=Streptomyces misionensis TaxID=67331 RepID=UPI0034479507
MDHAHTAASHAQAAHAAGELAQALRLLLAYAQAEPSLAAALSLLDTTEMSGTLDEAGLRAELAAAQAEHDANAALAERHARHAAAGHTHKRCTCGHPSSWHGRLTDDGRLPCVQSGCRCDDLTFA